LLPVLVLWQCESPKPREMNIEQENTKVLYIARHAKSSWKDASLRDFDRPLNKRGKRDAPKIGEVLKENGVQPGLIISSPARRAFKTARIYAKKLDYSKKDIITNENIYEASVTDLLEIISGQHDTIQSLMIVGHNPTFTALANYLTDEYIDNVPTGGVVAVSFPFDSWKQVDESTGKVLFYEYPKKYKKKKKE